MKKIILILSFLGISLVTVYAQQAKIRKDNYPYWTISKDVMRMQFKNVEFAPASITTGSYSWIYAKGLNQWDANTSRKNTGKVTMTGTPLWVVSKGVARMNAK